MTLLEMAMQSNSGKYLVFNVLGRRSTFTNTTDLHDVGQFLTGTTFPTVSAGEALEVVSSSASDAAAGTGTRKVRVVYLDDNGELKESDEITLNGLTPVAAGFTATAIISMEAVAGGSSEVSAGDIDLRKVTGATVLERIAAGGNKSLSGRITIPTGYAGYIVSWNAGAVNQDMDIRLRAQVRTLGREYNPRYLFQDTMYLALDQYDNSDVGLEYPAGCTIKASAIPGATTGNPRCDISFNIILVKL